jgi:hypothetical protein
VFYTVVEDDKGFGCLLDGLGGFILGLLLQEAINQSVRRCGTGAQRRARVWRVGGVPAMFPSIGRMQNGEIYPRMRTRRVIWQSSGPPGEDGRW